MDNPLQTQKIAELEGEVAKFRQEVAVKNQRILELEANGCALITLMLSNKLDVLRRYKQTFEYVDWTIRPWCRVPPLDHLGVAARRTLWTWCTLTR